MIRLRPHHLLCTQGYSGKGYSTEFVQNMSAIVHSLRNVPGTRIRLVFGSDSLCAHCPHHTADDLCEAQEKVSRFDRKTVEYFDLHEGEYVYQDLIHAIDAQMTPAMLEDICRGCAWYPVSACKRISAENEMRHTERCASPPVTRKYVVTSHNLSCPVLDIPTNFHQDIDNHLEGGYSYLIINTLQVIIKTEVRSMKRFKLSNSEEILMDTLWRENRPLTTLQLAEKVTEARWNTNYIDKLLGQLVKKGMVQVSGLLQNGRYQSRQFVPCYTKDEFLANMLEEQGVNQALFARIAVALFKKPAKSNESEQEEKLIAELEKMVDQYEAALQNKEEK